jgi:hypothetical protein
LKQINPEKIFEEERKFPIKNVKKMGNPCNFVLHKAVLKFFIDFAPHSPR